MNLLPTRSTCLIICPIRGLADGSSTLPASIQITDPEALSDYPNSQTHLNQPKRIKCECDIKYINKTIIKFIQLN